MKIGWVRLHPKLSAAATGLLAASLPGLSWQHNKSGFASEQVKSLLLGKTVKGEADTVGCGETMAADRLVVALKVL